MGHMFINLDNIPTDQDSVRLDTLRELVQLIRSELATLLVPPASSEVDRLQSQWQEFIEDRNAGTLWMEFSECCTVAPFCSCSQAIKTHEPPETLSELVQKNIGQLYREHVMPSAGGVHEVADYGSYRRALQNVGRFARKVSVLDRYLLQLNPKKLAAEKNPSRFAHRLASLGLIIDALMSLPSSERPRQLDIYSEVLNREAFYHSQKEAGERKHLRARWTAFEQDNRHSRDQLLIGWWEWIREAFDPTFKVDFFDCSDKKTSKGRRLMHDRFISRDLKVWYISSAGFCLAGHPGIDSPESLRTVVQESPETPLGPSFVVRVPNRPENIFGSVRRITEGCHR